VTEQPIAEFIKIMPCANGCTRKGTDDNPQHLAARHGRYCDRCYYSTDGTLRRAGELVQHILSMVGGIQSKVDDGSQRTKKHPPLPFNVEAFNDANEIYSQLVYWTSVWATRLNRPAPGPAARAWRTENNRVVGLPNDIDPKAARYAVSIMGTWLSAHLDLIYATHIVDDIDYFRIAVEENIYRTLAKWPVEDRAEYVPVTCWVIHNGEECKAKIAIWPPKFAKDDREIRCDRGDIFTEDDYDNMSAVFRQVRNEQAREIIKAHKTAERLAKKYGAA